MYGFQNQVKLPCEKEGSQQQVQGLGPKWKMEVVHRYSGQGFEGCQGEYPVNPRKAQLPLPYPVKQIGVKKEQENGE